MKCIKIVNDTKFMLVSFDVNLMYTLIDVHAQKNILIVMLQIFDNLSDPIDMYYWVRG